MTCKAQSMNKQRSHITQDSMYEDYRGRVLTSIGALQAAQTLLLHSTRNTRRKGEIEGIIR